MRIIQSNGRSMLGRCKKITNKVKKKNEREKKMIALLKTLNIVFYSTSSLFYTCSLYGDRGHLFVFLCEEVVHLIYVSM